jgi:colanic acid biosynthesis protein WcaH
MILSNTLYRKIRSSIPISTVDLVVSDGNRNILLLKRTNKPAKGDWWFPGGRVYYNESRMEAAKRKLREECGLGISTISEIGTYDIVFNDCVPHFHVITTVFFITTRSTKLILDDQSGAGGWKTHHEWRSLGIHRFVDESISKCLLKKNVFTKSFNRKNHILKYS